MYAKKKKKEKKSEKRKLWVRVNKICCDKI